MPDALPDDVRKTIASIDARLRDTTLSENEVNSLRERRRFLLEGVRKDIINKIDAQTIMIEALTARVEALENLLPAVPVYGGSAAQKPAQNATEAKGKAKTAKEKPSEAPAVAPHLSETPQKEEENPF